MDDFGTSALHDSAHNVNGCVMAIEKGRSRYNPDRISGFVWFGNNHFNIG
jgi:hypothetical protein